MKAYPEYKSSGIEWLGEIPSHWEKCAFKYFLTQISEVSTSNNKVGLENIESGTGQFNATDSLFEGNGIDFKMGDVLYGKLRPYLRKVWIAEFDGNAVGDFFVYRVQKNATEKYVKWLFLSNGFTEIANSSTDGAKMPRVSSDFIRNLEYYLPPLCEQTAIAAYLDVQTAKIDALIAEKQKQVEELRAYRTSLITETVTRGLNPDAPLRHSGIDWLGDIPEHWKLSKLKFIGEARNGLTYSPDDICDENEGVLVLRSSNIQNEQLIFEDNVYVSKQVEELMMQEGDILICSRNGSAALIGKCAIIPKGIVATFGAFMMRFRSKIDSKYCMYLIRTTLSEHKAQYATSTINQLTNSMIGNMRVALPPHAEQKAIAEFLDAKTSKIDTLIDELNKQLDELAEYRQAVITEAVTGKVDVRDYRPQN